MTKKNPQPKPAPKRGAPGKDAERSDETEANGERGDDVSTDERGNAQRQGGARGFESESSEPDRQPAETSKRGDAGVENAPTDASGVTTEGDIHTRSAP